MELLEDSHMMRERWLTEAWKKVKAIDIESPEHWVAFLHWQDIANGFTPNEKVDPLFYLQHISYGHGCDGRYLY